MDQVLVPVRSDQLDVYSFGKCPWNFQNLSTGIAVDRTLVRFLPCSRHMSSYKRICGHDIAGIS